MRAILAAQVTDISKLVAATANRLRLVQVDFADESDDARRGYLAEQVKQALDRIVPEERKAFLEVLSQQFPTWEFTAPAAPAPKPGLDDSVLSDPEFLVGALVDLLPSLPESKKRQIAERLEKAKLVRAEKPAAPVAASGQLEQELRQRLGIAADARVDGSQMVALFASLSDFSSALDQLVWKTWRQMAPRSTLRRPTELRLSIGACLAGQQTLNDAQVTQNLDRLRKLTAAIISAVSQAGPCARQNVAEMAPTVIRDVVTAAGVGLLKNRDIECWKKYIELFDTNEPLVESRVMDAVAKYAASLLEARPAAETGG